MPKKYRYIEIIVISRIFYTEVWKSVTQEISFYYSRKKSLYRESTVFLSRRTCWWSGRLIGLLTRSHDDEKWSVAISIRPDNYKLYVQSNLDLVNNLDLTNFVLLTNFLLHRKSQFNKRSHGRELNLTNFLWLQRPKKWGCVSSATLEFQWGGREWGEG